jgi:hypothetical protein
MNFARSRNTLIGGFFVLATSIAHAYCEEPEPAAVLGDWDMGQSSAALRITVRDQNTVFVQFCRRDLLVSNHLCDAEVILYFSFSPNTGEFSHIENSGQHLHAILRIDPTNTSKIHYQFTSDAGSGELIGSRLP